jgi:hypothetical protein
MKRLVIFVLMASVLLGAKAFGWPVRGYLKIVGPAPLWFQPVPQSPAAPLVLPPLPAERPAPAAPEPPAPAASATNDTVTAQSPAPAGPANPPPAGNDEQATPQTLLGFFKQKNAPSADHESSVVAPIGFVPPKPSDHPSSTATYESP